MPRFCMLASGSSGNAAYIDADGVGILIDMGLGPRMLGARLAAIGASWKSIHAVVLTHVHSDHWKDRTLAQLRSHRIPLYCHAAHAEVLSRYAQSYQPLHDAGLVRAFEAHQAVVLPGGLSCLPIPIPHDSDPTFAFRIDGPPDLLGGCWSVGYAADLGNMPAQLIELFRDVHLLALEFNHDEEMERSSGRPRQLIDRVLGEHGHLSNRQAAESLDLILQRSSHTNLRHLVQLHLSSHCNRPVLAQAAARKVVEKSGRTIDVHTAYPDRTTKALLVG